MRSPREELSEDRGWVLRTFRRNARYPAIIAALVRLGGRGAVTVFLLVFLPRGSERLYFRRLGMSREAEEKASQALLFQAFAFWTGIATTMYLMAFVWDLAAALLWLPPSGSAPNVRVLFIPAVFAVMTLFFAVPGFSTRTRLLASAFRCIRLVRALSPDPLPNPDLLTTQWLKQERRPGTHRRDEIFLLLLRNPQYRRRVVAGVAWALARCFRRAPSGVGCRE